MAIKDDLENRINNLRSKNRVSYTKLNNFVNLSLPEIENDYRYKAILIIILNFPKLYDLFEKQLIEIKFTNNSLHEVKEVIFNNIRVNSDISYNQLIENLKEKNLIELLGDLNIEVIFSRLQSSDKDINIDDSRQILEELIFMVNN